jgi:hypothetical protein
MDYSDAWAMRAAQAGNGDWSLDRLVELLEDEHGVRAFPLTVLVGTVLVKGLAVRTEEWAGHLDASMEELLAAAADMTAKTQGPVTTVQELQDADLLPGEIEQARAEWAAHGWRSLLDRQRAQNNAIDLEIEALDADAPFESLPDQVARRVVELELPKTTLTIRDAMMFVPGQGPVALPYIRVMVSQVGAWWPNILAVDAPER